MMNGIKQFLFGILGLSFIVGLLYFLYKIIEIVFDNIDKVNPNIIVASIAGSVTIIGYFISRYIERKKVVELQIREQKLPIYEEFVAFLMKMLFDDSYRNLSEDEKSKKIMDFMLDFTPKSLLWFSDETLLAIINWRNISQKISNGEDSTIALKSLENVFFAFRKDVGHANKKINKGDLLSLFITDIDTYRDKLA